MWQASSIKTHAMVAPEVGKKSQRQATSLPHDEIGDAAHKAKLGFRSFSLQSCLNYFHKFWKGVRLSNEPAQILALEALESCIVTEPAREHNRNRRIYAAELIESFLRTHYRQGEIKKN